MVKKLFTLFTLTILFSLPICNAIYNDASEKTKESVRNEALILADMLEFISSDIIFLENTAASISHNLTLIDINGAVLYDSEQDHYELESRASLPELVQAIQNGTGEAQRNSPLTNNYSYYYAVKLGNGNIIRISAHIKTFSETIGGKALQVAAITVIFGFVIFGFTRILRHASKNRSKDTLKSKPYSTEHIIDAINCGVMVLSAEDRILYCNKYVQAIPYDKLSSEAEYIMYIRSVINGNYTEKKLRINGKVYKFSANPLAIADKHGSHAVAIFISDITEKEQCRQQLLRNAVKAIHKLNNIHSSTDNIENIHFKELMQNVSCIIQLERDCIKEKFVVTDMAKICRCALKAIRSKAEALGIAVTADLTEAKINGYVPILYCIAYALLDNAVIYNKPNGSISISLKKEAERIILSVCDTGIGITAEAQSKIFEYFYQAKGNASQQKGAAGLGLCVVKRGALLHNAELAISSKPDIGTEMLIAFHKA